MGITVVLECRDNVIFSDEESTLNAVVGHETNQVFGIFVLPHLADGVLVWVLLSWCQPFPEFYLYVPSRAKMLEKIAH